MHNYVYLKNDFLGGCEFPVLLWIYMTPPCKFKVLSNKSKIEDITLLSISVSDSNVA